MPKSQLDCSSSDTGVVTRSLAVLNQGIVEDKQVTVPCTIKLDKLSQSTEKLQLKDGVRYYILRKAAKQSYKIEAHRVLRTRNQSMPSAIQKPSRMNRSDPRDQRYQYFPPSRGSGIKRPLNSPPNDYEKQRRYENQFHGGFHARGRGGHDFNSRRPWSRGGPYGHGEVRGGYRGHSPGANYGQRSYSSDDRRNRNRMPSPERYSRPHRSEKYVTANDSYRNSDHPLERKRHRSEQDSIRGKPLVHTYQKSSDNSYENKIKSPDGPEKKHVTVQNNAHKVNKELTPNTLAEKAVVKKVDSKGASTETAKTEASTCLSDCNKGDQSLSKSNDITVNRTTKKKDVLPPSQQMETMKEEKTEALPKVAGSAKDPGVCKKPESPTTHVNENTNDSSKGSAHGTEMSVSSDLSVRTKTNEVESKPLKDVKQNVTTTPVKVHSARKSAPSSILSRTQRKEMLQKQALLKAQNASGPVIPNNLQGSPKAKMGSNSIQIQNDIVNHIDNKEHITSMTTSSPVKEAFTPPRSEDIVVLSDTEEEENALQTQESSNKPLRISKVDSSNNAEVVTGETASSSIQVLRVGDVVSLGTKSSVSQVACHDTSDTSNIPADTISTKEETESGSDKAVKPLAEENSKDTEKAQSSKLKALQKIKDNLKKNLQKGRTSPQAISPSRSGELPHGSSSPGSPSKHTGDPEDARATTEVHPATTERAEQTQESSTMGSDIEPLRDDNSSILGVDTQPALKLNTEQTMQEGQTSDESSHISRDLVDNIVASFIADDILKDSQNLALSICNSVVSRSTTDSNSDIHEPPLTVSAEASKENAPSTSTNVAVTVNARSISQDEDVSQEKRDGVKLLAEETSCENIQASDNPDDSSPQDTDENNGDNLSDISVDLGPEEPDDMTCNDDHLLEDEPEVTEIEDFDAGLSGISITRVESQSTTEPEAATGPPSFVSKRSLPEADKEEDGMPVSKKIKPDNVDGVEGDGSSNEGTSKGSAEQTGGFLDGGESPVVFTDQVKEWKEFALSIKEKYEKLVQTFKQKTNEMYEAQARWQHENLLLKEKYQDLKQKYEGLTVSCGENPTIKKRNVEVQTLPVRKTHQSRKKGNPSPETSVNSQPTSPQDIGENAKASEDATTNPSSGTAPNLSTSEQNSAAAAASGTNVSSASPTTNTSNAALPKGSNLEVKRQNFMATLSKVIQGKKSVPTTGESGSVPSSPSGQTLSPRIEDPSPSSPHPGDPERESEEVPMDTTPASTSSDEPVEQTSSDAPKCVEEMQQPGTSGTTNAAKSLTDAPKSSKSAEIPLTQTNAASTNSGKDTTAVQYPHNNTSKPPTSTDTSKPPSQSTSAISTKQASNDAMKDPPGTKSAKSSEIHKDPATGSSSKPSESSTNSSKPPETGKSSTVVESSKVSAASAEPEIIDLTDDPDPPITTTSHTVNNKTETPAAKHTPLATRSPHALVSAPSPSKSLPSRTTTSVTPSKRIASSASTSSSVRQTQMTPQNVQSALSKSGQQPPSSISPSLRPRSGSAGSATSGKGSPGVPKSSSPQKPYGTTNTTPVQGIPVRSNASTTSAANVQLRNINPPAVAVPGQGANLRSAVVTLQHGMGQQMPSQVTSTQVLPGVQQRSGQVIARTNPAVSVTVVPSQQGSIRMQGQMPIQVRVQQQQQQNQQISLQMLQQQRQGIHQLPGAAASAAALATRQPQTAWLHKQRPQPVTSAAQVVQVVQQQVGKQQILTPAQMQMQVISAHGLTNTSATQSQTTAVHHTRQQQAQQQFQGLARAPTGTQEQIQAQERAHAINQAQAKEKALRQQREQEQQHAARQAAASLHSSQASQQEAKRTQLRKLHQEKLDAQQAAQTQQGRLRMLKDQIQRAQSYQRTLKNRLKTYAHGIDPTQFKSIENQWVEVQEQERKLNAELKALEERLKAHNEQSNLIDQKISLLAGASSSTVPPQELQKQQQQLQQQLQKQQFQQQRNRQIQQQQQRQQQQQTPEKKHPADLPDMFSLPDIPSSSRFTPAPLCPLLEIKHSPEGIVLSWKMRPAEIAKVDVKRYLLYAYQESESATPSTDLWKKIGAVEALPLPMACTLTHFKAGSMYHFAVCAISKHDRPGQFSNIGSINLP